MSEETRSGNRHSVNRDCSTIIWQQANAKLAGMRIHDILAANKVAVICTTDDPADPLGLSLAQYVVRLAGQGALETYGVTPLPEPIRIQTFTPLKVTVDPNASAAPSAGTAPASAAPSASPVPTS